MPFLPPNQQRQSTEGMNLALISRWKSQQRRSWSRPSSADLLEVRNGVAGVLHVEPGDAVRAEEDGHDDEDSGEDADVGDGEAAQQERRDAAVRAVQVEHDDRQQVGGDADQAERPDEDRVVEEVEAGAGIAQPERRHRRGVGPRRQRSVRLYTVRRKSKLTLILSEHANKTEKIGGLRTNTNICRENGTLPDIFSVLCLKILCPKAVAESRKR